MKKKLGITIFSTIGIVTLVLNVILFICINSWLPNQLKNGVFWFVWAMTFIVNNLITVGVFIFYKNSKKYDSIVVPPLIYIMICFNIAYLLLGLILMFIPPLTFTVALILELLVTAAYALVLIYYLSVTNYMKSNSAEKKVLFIRSLYVDVDSAAEIVSDIELKNKLKKLSEDIRFSDPMSANEIIELDKNIQQTIQELVVYSMEKNFDKVNELADKASVQLKYRNAKCKIMK